MSGAPRETRVAAIVAVFAIARLTAGCATSLTPESMVPNMPLAATPRTQLTLTVAPVTSQEETSALASLSLEPQYTIANEPFQEALVEALDNSGIFRSVESSGPADYELRAHIVSQQTQLSGFATTSSSLVVNYRLRESAGNREVWHDTIISRGVSDGRPAPEVGSGAARKSLAASARRSIAELLEKLSEQIR